MSEQDNFNPNSEDNFNPNSGQENFSQNNEQEYVSQDSGQNQTGSNDGQYSYSYREINQGDPVGATEGDRTGSQTANQSGTSWESQSGDRTGTTWQSQTGDQTNQQTQNRQTGPNYYQWNPYQEPKKKGFFQSRKEKRAGGNGGAGNADKKSGGKFSVKLAKAAAIALVFGLVAGVVFEGSSYLMGKVLGTNQPTKQVAALSSGGNLDSTATSSAITVNDVSDIVENVMPAIVAVTNMTTVQYQNFFGRTGTYESQSAGSGIIISQDDEYIYIATNNHVVSGAETLTITFVDGKSVVAEIKGTDPSTDLAVVAVPIKDIDSETRDQIKVATIGDSGNLKVGQSAIVIGNALGYGQSVSAGIISAQDREVTIQDNIGQAITNQLIQTDAAVNPGNSGGALVDMNGQVIGIVSAKYTDTDVEGMGYAIPITSAASIIEQLINREELDESQSGYLGVSGADVTSSFAKQYNLPAGVYITQVVKGSPAAEAGLSRGDVITSFDGRKVTSFDQLLNQIKYIKAGTEVELTVARAADDYKETTLKITLAKRK